MSKKRLPSRENSEMNPCTRPMRKQAVYGCSELSEWRSTKTQQTNPRPREKTTSFCGSRISRRGWLPAQEQSTPCLGERDARVERGRGHVGRLLRARRERPRSRYAAECSQQFPPSDGDCHTPLPLEVRKWNDSTPRARGLHGSRRAGALKGRSARHRSCQPAPEHFQQCAEFPLLRNRPRSGSR